MKRDIERRAWRLSDVEVRSGDGDGLSFKGYAAVFGDLSENLGGFREKIAPGAFRKTLKDGADVRFLVNHDPNLLLARRGSGSLRLDEDERGLATEADMANVSYARDASELIVRGDLDQMSFAFVTVKDEWEDRDGEVIRTLKEVRLLDVSVVTYPAYPTTVATVRGVDVDAIAARIGTDHDATCRALNAVAGAVDPEVYAAALYELREGRALSQNNRHAIVAVIESLQTMVRNEPESEEAGADEATTSDEATTRDVEILRRQLELKLKALAI